MPTGKPQSTIYGPVPTEPLQMANKQYVDSLVAGGQTFARVVKKVDEIVNNSTVLQSDDELLFAVNANKAYGFMMILFLDGKTADDMKMNFSLPAGASGRWSIVALLRGDQTSTSTDITTSTLLPFAANVNQFASFVGHIIIAGTPGSCILQWAQNTASVNDLTVLKGSFLVVWEELP